MQRFDGQSLGIDQGALILFSDFEDDGEMWAGEGPRLVRRPIYFSHAFAAPLALIVGLSMEDMDRQTNGRADICAEDIEADGSRCPFGPGATGDSRIARVRANWTAIGPLPDPELWTLS